VSDYLGKVAQLQPNVTHELIQTVTQEKGNAAMKLRFFFFYLSTVVHLNTILLFAGVFPYSSCLC
jgi:hypothetical protein